MASFIPAEIWHRGAIVRSRATPCARRTPWRVHRIGFEVVLVLVLLLMLCDKAARATPFSIVVLPDTQHYIETSPIPAQQTQWIVDNLAARKIAFVSHLGDVVDHGSQAGRWTNISNAMTLLDGEVPYSVVQGNHDPDPPSPGSCPCSLFLSYFGEPRYVGSPWYGGKMPAADRPSFYQFFEGDGIRFLHIGLELRYTGVGVIDWARAVIAANPGLPVIISTHAYLDVGGRNSFGSMLWTQFIQAEPQIFMVLNGHFLEPTSPAGDAEFSQISMNEAGLPVIEMLANYQQRANGGNGWLRIIEVDRAASLVRFSTYSPTLDLFETDADSEFAVSFDLAPRLSQCNDGIDNDSDGHVDFPADTDCGGYAESFEGVPRISSLTPPSASLLILSLAAMGILAMSALIGEPGAQVKGPDIAPSRTRLVAENLPSPDE